MRIDVYMASVSLCESREQAKKLISDKRVLCDGKTVEKPSKDVGPENNIEILKTDKNEYVSRGGYKLEAALDHFGIDVCGLTAADIGASSGGFSDCLLQRGIGRIYAVDCGNGQLCKKIAENTNVISLENTNARYIDDATFGEKVDIAVMDLSFISQTLVFPAITRILKNGGILISLIKPQFEAGRDALGKNGIVKDEKKRREAVRKVIDNAMLFGLISRDVIDSPIKGGDGNTEYLTVFDYFPDKKYDV